MLHLPRTAVPTIPHSSCVGEVAARERRSYFCYVQGLPCYRYEVFTSLSWPEVIFFGSSFVTVLQSFEIEY